MNLLYIPSGYGQIYPFFDLSIERALNKIGMNTVNVSAYDPNFINKLNTYKPDIAITMVGFKIPMEIINLLRKKNVLTALWSTEDPYYIDETIKIIDHFDVIFTIDLGALEIYQSLGHHHVYHLPLGTDPEIFFPTKVEEKYKSDICLVGFPYPNRVQLIKNLLEKSNYHITVIGTNWDKQLQWYQSAHLTIIPKWLPPSTINMYYNGAKINVNTHRPFQFKKNRNKQKVFPLSINNRTFDLASSRSFQLTDFKKDLFEHFRKNDIAHFENSDEFIKRTDHFLTNETERTIYAKNAYETVLKKHTFYHRMEKFLEIINKI